MSSLNAFLSLSRRLRAYLLAWYVLGAAAIVYSLALLPRGQWPSLALYFLVSFFLNVKIVRGALKAPNSSATVSLASAAAFAAIAGVHPLAGVPVEVFSILMDSFFPKRRPLYQVLFNVSVCSVGTLAAGLLYHALSGPSLPFQLFAPGDGQGLYSLIPRIGAAAGPMLAASLTYFVINTVGVAEVVGLVSGTSMMEFWRRSFQSSFVGYTASGACAVFVLGLSPHMPLASLILLSGPILYACYSREQTDEARVVALEKGKERLESMYIASIKALALTVAARDRYTSGHIHRVMTYADAIAQRLGLSEEERTDLKTGALLHDIGKIGVPEYILTKPGKLTPEEMDAMRRHAEIGWTILQPLDSFPDIVKEIVRHHHEWHNGTGYPDGMTGDKLPLLVKITGVADVFDALTSDRPYRAALSLDESREIMRKNSGSQFDPDVLRAFFDVLDAVPFEALRAAATIPTGSDGLFDPYPSPFVSSSLHIPPMEIPESLLIYK